MLVVPHHVPRKARRRMVLAAIKAEPSGTARVRVLSSPEELAEAVARAQAFEQRTRELLAMRAQRHQDALAKLPSAAAPGTAKDAG
jgi:hypothetical protein